MLLGTEPLLQRQALRQRLIEAEQMLGQQGAQGPSSAGMSCLSPHQRLGDGLGNRGGELQPPGGEPGAQKGIGMMGQRLPIWAANF